MLKIQTNILETTKHTIKWKRREQIYNCFNVVRKYPLNLEGIDNFLGKCKIRQNCHRMKFSRTNIGQ